MKTYKGIITSLPPNGIFVFGSNTQGRHGLGAAKVAREKFGARYGQASGRQGQSFAIITKDLTKKVHPSVDSRDIELQIMRLYEFAEDKPGLDFYIAYSAAGKNLNAYSPQEMANMFTAIWSVWNIPENIIFEENFAELIAV